jgi:hypothetical protein
VNRFAGLSFGTSSLRRSDDVGTGDTGTTGTAPGTVNIPTRKITAGAVIRAVDDETFGNNDETTAELARTQLLSSVNPIILLEMEVKVGGELRVELRLDASLSANGDAIIEGDTKLFEGTSEESNDLDGEKQFTVLVPAGAAERKEFTIRNEDEGGDFAEVKLNFTNDNP